MEEAIAKIRTNLTSLQPVTLPLSTNLLGLVLAEDVLSPHSLPPFRASMKDGYAVASSSTFSENQPFRVAGKVSAGSDASTLTPLARNECAYITTGAPMPPGSDAVVMVEYSRLEQNYDEEYAYFTKWISGEGSDVRPIGVDVRKGEVLMRKGEVVGAAEIGLITSCGVHEVKVHPRVRIGVISTGDEIMDAPDAGETWAEVHHKGKIADSNRPMLLALVKEYLPFCDSVDLGIVRDSCESLRSALIRGSEQCDILITSGGVSMGNRDYVKPLLEELGNVHFGRVLMKPGKPLTFCTFSKLNSCVIGLPGNPVSAFVCFHLAVTVAAKTLAGQLDHGSPSTMIDVCIENDVRLDPQRPEYHRVTVKVSFTTYPSQPSMNPLTLLEAKSVSFGC